MKLYYNFMMEYSNRKGVRWFAFSDSVLVLDNCLMRQVGSAA